MVKKISVGNKKIIVQENAVLIYVNYMRDVSYGLFIVTLISIILFFSLSQQYNIIGVSLIFALGSGFLGAFYLKSIMKTWKWKLDLNKKFFYFNQKQGLPFSAFKEMQIKTGESARISTFKHVLILVNQKNQHFNLFKSRHRKEIENVAKLFSKSMNVPLIILE
ncbi:MAG: hypothetical protein ACK4K0_02985 [Flavobacteriales bacterium]